MVSSIQNQKVEQRLGTMTRQDTKAPSKVALRGDSRPGKLTSSYRASLEHELRAADRGMDDYAKALQILVSRQQSAPKTSMLKRAMEYLSRKNETQSTAKLLRDWKRENKSSRISQYTKHNPVSEPVRKYLKDDQQPRTINTLHFIPVACAVIASLVVFFANLVVPGSFVSGFFARSAITLPETKDTQDLLIRYANPLTDDKISQVVAGVDTRRFQMLSVQDYVVQPGDTLSAIATRYNLNMDTIISFNNISNPRALKTGQLWKIPNRNGLMYKIAANDTLETLAVKFNTDTLALLDANNMADPSLVAGQQLFIPEARMNPTDLKMLLGELFMWPTVGRFTSSFGYRVDPFTGQRRLHNGIDLANGLGVPVRAALAGKVVAVESQLGNYGKVVIVQHSRGFKTLYAHLDSFAVQLGQSVSQGQLIARMGNTGRSTGAHLHFSVIHNGVFVNPMRYLK